MPYFVMDEEFSKKLTTDEHNLMIVHTHDMLAQIIAPLNECLLISVKKFAGTCHYYS